MGGSQGWDLSTGTITELFTPEDWRVATPVLRSPTHSKLVEGTVARKKDPSRNSASWWPRFQDSLFQPVDIASIAVFRMMFGAVLFWEVWRFFQHDWVRKFYIDRVFYFKYFGFEWVHPWPGDGMYIHFLVCGILALCIAFGAFYRITSVLFLLGFTYWFLLDQTRYLNHLYFAALIAFLLAVTPAHRARSVDAWRKPQIRSSTIPAWYLWLLRFQIGTVYFYAAIAKMNADWFAGEPMRSWLLKRADYPLIGWIFEKEWAAGFFSHGGLLYDLLVVPLLLWRKTRLLAFAATLYFHGMNKLLFNIGIFPPLMLAATLLFFDADWPRKALLFFAPHRDGEEPAHTPTKPETRRWVLAFLAVYVAIQVLVPLRHFLYPGTVHWTEEGHRFSWHMKLRDKKSDVSFFATDPTTGKTWEVNQREYLSSTQRRKVGNAPDMCLQFAHFLADTLREQGYEDIEIRVRSRVSLNFREKQDMIDPTVDLSKEPRTLFRADWILPLEEETAR